MKIVCICHEFEFYAMKYIISCEHASNRIPQHFLHVFQGRENIHTSHRAYDPGAAALARRLAGSLHGPLYLGSISRLLIDLNRSPTNRRTLFSAYARKLTQSDREMLLREYYFPFRRALEDEAAGIIAQGKTVLHLSIHSFTPMKDAVERKADIGLLYDPARECEKRICAFLHRFLHGEIMDLRVRRNYPYLGKTDGFTAYMRRRYTEERYIGVEIEMNQALLLSRSTRKKQAVDALLRGTGEIDKYL